eukprot:5027191-Pyramimonas_sp.AAC.1
MPAPPKHPLQQSRTPCNLHQNQDHARTPRAHIVLITGMAGVLAYCLLYACSPSRSTKNAKVMLPGRQGGGPQTAYCAPAY